MRILTEKINLDLNQNGIQATIDLREGDIESRLIIATLRGYGDAFRPDENVIAVIRAKKPDGTIIYNNCLVEDGKVKFLVTSQYAAVVGNYNACIELIKDGVVLYSPKFSFHVAENELSDSEVESASEYTELTTALEQALTALELAQNLHLLKFVENLEDEGDEKYLYVLTSDYHYIPYVWDAENERYMELESNLEELAEFSYLLSIQKERVDNLLAEAVPGSTTRDLEVIDGRTGYDGRTYANLGTAIREQVNDLHSENTNLQNSMEAADDNLDNIKANKSDVNTTTANIEAEIAVERTRIDNIASLAEGSTTGDAELTDIRVGADGITYNNAGNSVRGQTLKLKNNLILSNNCYEYFDLYGAFVNGAIQNGELKPAYSYRVSTDTIMSFDRDILVEIKNGFYICAFYFEGSTYSSNSSNVATELFIPKGKSFKLEIRKITEVIVQANIDEFVHAVKFKTEIGEIALDYKNEFAKTLNASNTYNGYFKLNGTALNVSSDIGTKKYIIPIGTTKIYIKTRFSGLMGVSFSDIEDPTTDYLGYPINCTKDPLNAYTSLTDHEKTYTLDRYYKCVYIPYYIPWGVPTVIAYRESAFDTFWQGIRPLAGKNVLVFGDSITYTFVRWRENFFKLTRANELACISCAGAHLTDYNTTTPLDGNYTSTADGGVHNVVCNQVYYWLNNTPTEIEPDVIIISAGTNDVKTNEELSVDTNVYTDSNGWLDVDTINRTTFEGAMRWITSKLRTKYQNAIIVFASPIQSAETLHPIENQLAKEEKMIRVCKRLSAKIIKATSESGITGEFEIENQNGRYLIDGLHPNEKGGYLLGKYYADTLETLLKNI